MNIAIRAIWFLCGFLWGWVAFAIVAHSAPVFPEPPITEHTWIQKGPYTLRMPSTPTHCCERNHCRMLPPGQVVRVEDGFVVMPSPPFLEQAQFVPEAEAYWTEEEGEGAYWICVVAQKVRCLFVPALGF